MHVLAVLWGPFGFRLDELAEALHAERISITLLYGQRYYAPLRYVALFFRTLILLFRSKPDVVYAQNPPIFCPFTSLIYCRISGKRLLVDHHSVWRVKTIGGPVGRAIGLLEAFVSMSADANTAPHSEWGRRLRETGARRVEVIHDFVSRNTFSRDELLRRKYSSGSLLAIASHGGHPLELLETEVAAASRVAGLTLLISGPEEKLAPRFNALNLPPNVKYLGFLPRSEYERLKASADFALNITTEPFTLSHVLFEFAACGLPTITSRQGVVEEVFGNSLEYLDTNGVEEAALALKRFTEDSRLRGVFAERIAKKHRQLMEMNRKELAGLRALLAA